jgi:hypothetical protein
MRAVALVAVVAGLVAGLLLAFALANAGDGDPPTRTPVAGAELLQPYESSFVDLWVRGCVSSGDPEAFCHCAIAVYTSRLRPDEFETASAIAQSGGQLAELPENVRDAVETVERDCR